MPHPKIFAALLCLACGASAAEPPPAPPPGPIVTQIMKQDLPDMPGKEALMLLVEYPPGGVDPVHRHDAHGLIYVLEGEIVMGVRGGAETVLRPGQAFHEGPDDIHAVGRNASATRPARFLAVLIKNRNTPPVLPAR